MSQLIAHSDPNQIVAYVAGESVSAHHFLHQVKDLAGRMTERQFVLNICSNRLNFAIGFCAAVMAGCSTLMPSTLAPELVGKLRERYPSLLIIWDNNNPFDGLAHFRVNAQSMGAAVNLNEYLIPEISDHLVAAYVFTSGSTGLPQAHPKTWGLLHRNAQAQALRVRETLNTKDCDLFTLIGTVPAQHMYGFESTVLLALLTGNAFAAEHPFFTADIVEVIKQTPGSKVLVSTPFHLGRLCRELMEQTKKIDPITLVFCATSSLSQVLAQQIASTLQAKLLEIYGCTESGQLATRTTNETVVWHTYENIVVEERCVAAGGEAVQFVVSGGHVSGEVVLGDILSVQDSTHFELLGRDEDMINVAGKRQSLANLTHHLCAVEGVNDGVYFLPNETNEDISQGNIVRPVVFVVGEDSDSKRILDTLRKKIDAVFLPRRIHFVEKLPRNTAGKLPRQAMLDLYQSLI